MKIVQSLWSKPTLGSNDKTHGGWLDKKYHYMSWALSCLQLRKYYNEVELYTDDLGKQLLVDKLMLPYTQVHTSLNEVDHYSTYLWMIGKIYTYKQQTSPFIHVDSDIFIWDRFGERLESAPIVAQEIENSYETYRSFILDSDLLFKYVPESFKSGRDKIGKYASCYNAGILGGNAVTFLCDYAAEALKFIDKNFDMAPHNSPLQRLFPVLSEQYLLFYMAKQENVAAEVFIDNYHFYSLNKDIRRVAKNLKFVHLMGGRNGGFKSDMACCSILENWLKTYYPDYFYLILRLLDNHEL